MLLRSSIQPAAVLAAAAAPSCCVPQPPARLHQVRHRRPVSTSSRRDFLQSWLSLRFTDRERREEEKRAAERLRRLQDLTGQAKSPALMDSSPASVRQLDAEAAFSPEVRARWARGRQEFDDSIFLYLQRYGPTRRGHVEFIEASLRRMKELGVHKDLERYKALMDVFPKEVMRVRTMWRSEFKHYPRQQDTAIALLDTMNEHNVMPDTEMGLQISRIFGTESYVMAKFQRMMYWMPKLRHSDPWPPVTLSSSGLRYLPEPQSFRELAVQVLRRMCPDPETQVAAYSMDGPPGSDLFVASAQAPTQQRLLSELGEGTHVYLDGPNRVWFKDYRLSYYVLSADPTPLAREIAARERAAAPAAASTPQPLRHGLHDEDYAWWRRLRCLDERNEDADANSELARAPSEHELPDCTILALAIASSSGVADLLLRWVRLLAAEPGNEALQRAAVVLRLRQPEPAEEEQQEDEAGTSAGADGDDASGDANQSVRRD